MDVKSLLLIILSGYILFTIKGRPRPVMQPPASSCASSTNRLASLGMSFRPTQTSARSSGGQPGFPGSSLNLECSEANGIMPCMRTRMNWLVLQQMFETDFFFNFFHGLI